MYKFAYAQVVSYADATVCQTILALQQFRIEFVDTFCVAAPLSSMLPESDQYRSVCPFNLGRRGLLLEASGTQSKPPAVLKEPA